MIRRNIREVLVLLVFGSIVWWRGSVFPSTVPSAAPSVLSPTPTPTEGTPLSAIAQGFDPDPPLGLGLLNERLEILFDN